MKKPSFEQKLFLKFVTSLILVALFLFVYNFYQKKEQNNLLVGNFLEDKNPQHEVIGYSEEGRKIEAFTYGRGDKKIVFVGGIHGGYEWNSSLLAYHFLDYFNLNYEKIPEDISLVIVPVLNPDGLFKVIGKEGLFNEEDLIDGIDESIGRLNNNGVDLNRNFDCKWQEEATWRSKEVGAGTKVFSEAESRVLRDFVLENNPKAVIFWHSQAGAVYASECEDGVLPETLDLMNFYAETSGYKSVASFDAYAVTGDAEGWLASINIPSITVELKNHQDIDWEENLSGLFSVLMYYGEKSKN